MVQILSLQPLLHSLLLLHHVEGALLPDQGHHHYGSRQLHVTHPLGADEQGGTSVLQLPEVNACFCLMRNGRDSKLIPILDQLHAMVVVEKTSSTDHRQYCLLEQQRLQAAPGHPLEEQLHDGSYC